MLIPIALSLAIGLLIPVHLSMNSRAGALAGSAPLANTVFWIVGLSVSLAVSLRGILRDGLGTLPAVPWPLWLAGGIGTLISLGISVIIPRIGVANVTFLTIMGQMIASAILSMMGVLGSPKEALSPQKLLGIAVMAAGVALFMFAKAPAAPAS